MPSTVSTLKRFIRPQPNMQTLVAGLTGVLRRYGNDFNSCLNSLVFQKESKLIERPRVGASTLCLVSGLSVGSVADACQVLNGNNCALRLGSVDNDSTDIVVLPELKSLLGGALRVAACIKLAN